MKAYWKKPSTPIDDVVFGSATLLGIVSFFIYALDFDRAVVGKILQMLALAILLFSTFRLWMFDSKLGERFGTHFFLFLSSATVLGGFFVFMLEEGARSVKSGDFAFSDILLGGGFLFFFLFLLKTFLPLFKAYPISDIKQKIALFIYSVIILLTAGLVFLKWGAFALFGWIPLGYILMTSLTLVLTTGLVVYIDEGAFYTPIVITSIAFLMISGANLHYASSLLSTGFRTGGVVDLLWISGFLTLAGAMTIKLEILRNS